MVKGSKGKGKRSRPLNQLETSEKQKNKRAEGRERAREKESIDDLTYPREEETEESGNSFEWPSQNS